MPEVPLSRIINVSLITTPSGLTNFNVNSLAILTNESPTQAFADGYKVYYSPSDVATDFGSTSETYEQAVAVFSQSPNLLTGGGYLVVFPLETLSADSAGTMLTLVPASLTTFQSVTSGGFDIDVDGVTLNITGVDLHTATSFADIATLLSSAIAGCTVTYDASANGSQGGFLFTSDTTGALSSISALSSPASGTDLSTSTYLNGSGNVRIENGLASGSTENIVTALVRTQALYYYFGILITTAPTAAE